MPKLLRTGSSVCSEPENTRFGTGVREGTSREILGAGAMATRISGSSRHISGRSPAIVLCDGRRSPRPLPQRSCVARPRERHQQRTAERIRPVDRLLGSASRRERIPPWLRGRLLYRAHRGGRGTRRTSPWVRAAVGAGGAGPTELGILCAGKSGGWRRSVV